MVTPLFFYAFDNVITTSIAGSQMLKNYCVLALYLCLNDSCENSKTPVAVQSDNENTICPKCGATMRRLDLIQKSKKGGKG